MKTSIAILIIVIVAILVGGGIWWWASSCGQTSTQNSVVINKSSTKSDNSNNEIGDANENSIENIDMWETYTNDDLGFQIDLLPEVTVEMEENDEYNRLVYFTSENLNYEVRLRADDPEHPTELENYYFLDFVPLEQTTINGETANYYESEHGYCDAGMCGSPFTAYAMKHNDDFYVISFYNDTEISPEEERLIYSFKFTK